MQIAKTVGILIPTQMHFQGVYNLRMKRPRALKSNIILIDRGIFLRKNQLSYFYFRSGCGHVGS